MSLLCLLPYAGVTVQLPIFLRVLLAITSYVYVIARLVLLLMYPYDLLTRTAIARLLCDARY